MSPTILSTGRTYRRLLVAGFRRQSTYRLAALGGLVANTTFGLLKVAILFATVRAAGGELNGYDVGSISAYIWISQGMLGSVNLNGRTDIATRIKDGGVVVDFLRPLDVQAASIATEVGQSVFALIPRGLPTVSIGIFVVGMTVPGSPAGYLLGAGRACCWASSCPPPRSTWSRPPASGWWRPGASRSSTWSSRASSPGSSCRSTCSRRGCGSWPR